MRASIRVGRIHSRPLVIPARSRCAATERSGGQGSRGEAVTEEEVDGEDAAVEEVDGGSLEVMMEFVSEDEDEETPQPTAAGVCICGCNMLHRHL